MPVGEEDHTLHGEELEDRLVRPQKVLGGKVEQEEGVEGNGDAEVVDKGDIDVGIPWRPVAIFVEV